MNNNLFCSPDGSALLIRYKTTKTITVAWGNKLRTLQAVDTLGISESHNCDKNSTISRYC